MFDVLSFIKSLSRIFTFSSVKGTWIYQSFQNLKAYYQRSRPSLLMCAETLHLLTKSALHDLFKCAAVSFLKSQGYARVRQAVIGIQTLIIVDFCKAIGLPQVYCHCEITVYPGTDTQSEVHVDLFFRCWQGQGYWAYAWMCCPLSPSPSCLIISQFFCMEGGGGKEPSGDVYALSTAFQLETIPGEKLNKFVFLMNHI